MRINRNIESCISLMAPEADAPIPPVHVTPYERCRFGLAHTSQSKEFDKISGRVSELCIPLRANLIHNGLKLFDGRHAADGLFRYRCSRLAILRSVLRNDRSFRLPRIFLKP